MKKAQDFVNEAKCNLLGIETALTEAHSKAETGMNKKHIEEAMDSLQDVKRALQQFHD